MITDTVSKNVESTYDSNKGFSIKASAKAFRILSSGLYSDKISAPIRELGTNAWDSHIESGNINESFLVHCPSMLEPWFSIRDYGTGMSDSKIQNLYVTYFDSDRNTSNDYTGGFGLGSKTPFCYTDSFTVTSFYRENPNSKKCVKMVYNCYLNNEELPTISKIHVDENCTEKSGLEVKFPVHRNDIDEFKQKIYSVYNRFINKPIVVGADIKFKDVEYVFKSKTWGVRNYDYNNFHNNGSRALMGNIVYPINCDILRSQLTQKELFVLNLNIDLHFNIGELEVTPSRESLQYNDPTILQIIKKIRCVLSEIQDSYLKEVEQCKSLYDAFCLNYEVLYGDNRKLFKNIIENIEIKYNGEVVDGYSKDILELINIKSGDYEATNCITYKFKSGRRSWRDKSKATRIGTHDVFINRNAQFWVCDLKIGGHVRIKKLINDEACSNTYYNVLFFKNDYYKKKFIKKLGIKSTDLKNISSLPKPHRLLNTSKLNTTKVDRLVYLYNPSIVNKKTYMWDKSLIDVNTTETIYYVDFHSYDIICEDNEFKHINLDRFYNIYLYFKETDKNLKVYGIPKSFPKKVLEKKNWVNALSYFKRELTKMFSLNEIEKLKISKHFKSFEDINMNAVEKFIIKTAHCKLECKNKNAQEKLNEIYKNVEIAESVSQQKLNAYNVYCNICNSANELSNDDSDNIFKKQIRDFFNYYTLLKYISIKYYCNEGEKLEFHNEIRNYLKNN